ncbi:MAG: lipocalin family protein [Bacteroidales bacterium]|nr:lipocalin family protein [Bacteroidales bacterium]
MKRFVKLFAGLLSMAAVLSTVSCEKEVSDTNLVGKWQSTSIVEQSYEGDKLIGEYSESCIEWYIGFNFKDDGTCQLMEVEGNDSEVISCEWVLMGNKLILSSKEADESVSYEVVAITASSMTLKMVEEYTSDGVKNKYVSTIYFSKI